ncbi:MAG: FKBP-type peptidyl-prolyl cis-trans isomerase [Bacteroidota bacterium]
MRLLSFVLIVLLFGCTEEPKKPAPIKWTKENSTDLSKNLAAQEEIDIKLFLVQHQDWKMKKMPSGLRIFIEKETEGIQAAIAKTADVEMKMALLDGTVVYQTESDEYLELKIDKSDIESGINEGLKLMRVGEKAKLIIPSHLAQGLVGDFDKIPPLSILVVDIHLINVR